MDADSSPASSETRGVLSELVAHVRPDQGDTESLGKSDLTPGSPLPPAPVSVHLCETASAH